MWGRLTLAASLVVALAAMVTTTAIGNQGSSSTPAAAAMKCKRAIVNGQRECLKVGDPCKRAYQADYVRAGFSCTKGRLRKASLAELRGGEPLLVGPSGGISLKTALAAFDAQIADLPGIKARKGEVGALNEASMVVNEIEANRASLTPDQIAAFDAATTPAPDALVVPNEEPPPAPPPAPPATTSQRAGTLDEQILAELWISDAMEVYKAHGFTFPKPIKVDFKDTQTSTSGKPSTALAFTTSSDLAPGTSPTCNIFVLPSGRAAPAGRKEKLFAHELAHCAQHAFATSQSQFSSIPDWVIEGGADWLSGMAVAERGHDVVGVHWTSWLEHPETDLFRREYSAVGFFSMIHQASGQGWQRMRDVLTVATGGSETAYNRAWAGLPEVFHDRWGPGLVRDKSLGAEWEYEGPGLPTSQPKSINVGKAPKGLTVAAHASTAAKLTINGDVLIIRAKKQDARGLFRSGKYKEKLKGGAYCAKNGGCKCKTHTNLQLPQIDHNARLGFNGLFKGTTVTLEARSLQDYCKKPNPGPGPGGGGGGSSCPVGGSSRPIARGGDTPSCPGSAPGVMVFGSPCDDQGNCTLLATFRAADCTAGSGFTAISSDGAWRLEVGINAFSGFDTEYDIQYGGGNVNVVVDGPGGPYSNTTWVPPGLTNAGAVAFPTGTGSPVGVGWIEFRNASGADGSGIAGGGQMSCAYPEDD